MSNKVEVVGKDIDGNEVTVYVVRPTSRQKQEAKMYSTKVFTECMKDPNIMMKAELYDYLNKKRIFTEEDEKYLEKLRKENEKNLSRLTNGKKIKKKDAREICRKININRTIILGLENKVSSYEEKTVEGMTDQAYIDYLFYSCLLNEEGEQVFESVDECKDGLDQNYVSEAFTKFLFMLNGVKEDWYNDLPEAKFLRKHGLIDEQGRFVNENGELINVDGTLAEESEKEDIEDKFVELED